MLLCDKETIEHLTKNDLNDLRYFKVPENEIWRVNLLKELLDSRLDNIEIPGFSHEEISELIDFVCVS